jgi:peptidoglycan hydrolase CwlO-like protein
MSLKDSLITKLETQTENWKKEVDRIQAEAEAKKAKAQDKQADADIESQVASKVKDLQKNIEKAQNQLKEVKESGESGLKELRDRIGEELPGNQSKKGK